MRKTVFFKLSGSFLALAAATAAPAFAQTNNWTGGSSYHYSCWWQNKWQHCDSAGNNSWHNRSNWSAGIPTANQDVNIGLSTYQGGSSRPRQHDSVLNSGEAKAGNLHIGFSGQRGTAGGTGAGRLINSGTLDVSKDMVVGATGIGSFENSGKLNVDGNFIVGSGSTGTVASQGAITVGGVTVIGEQTGASGTVTLSGGGSLSTAGDLIVAERGRGTLDVGPGGVAATESDVTVAGHSTALGIVRVGGGTMHNEARLDVGREGEGYLLVYGGGSVDNAAGTLGTEEGSAGYAAVTGAGSVWANRESLTVAEGAGAMGLLVINNEGTVRVAGGEGTLIIAAGKGARGVLNIGAMSPIGADYGLDAEAGGYLTDIGLSAASDTSLAPGTLDAAYVAFGAGEGTVNFKHSATEAQDYRFKAGFESSGSVNHFDGFTVLEGDSSGFTGAANVLGGVVVVNNVLAGDVAVGAGGTLRIGHEGGTRPGDGTKGDVVNDILNDGLVQFNRADAYVYDRVISGSGAVEQMGSGTTVLTGENTYTGLTTVLDGTLQLGDGGAGGSIDQTSGVVVASGGALAFNRSDFKIFDREISGTGGLMQIGPGITRLTTDSSGFTGNTEIDAGTLSVNGTLGGTIAVNDGGTLEGIGKIGTATVGKGGTIAPGNRVTGSAIGKLTVGGDLIQEAGSSYQVEVLSTGEADQLSVTGATTISDNAILDVAKLDSARYELEHRYTILTAENGVTGAYGLRGDTSVSAFYRLEDRYDTNAVYLDVTQYRSFEEAGRTLNQIEAAAAVQSLKAQRDPATNYPTNPLYRAIAYLPDDADARNAFDQISGEVYASVQAGLLEESRFLREATGARMRAAFGGIGGGKALIYEPGIDIKDPTPRPVWVDAGIGDGPVLWGHGFGGWSGINGDGNAADLDGSGGGMVVGADMPVGSLFRAGVFGGYSVSEFGVDDRRSSIESRSYHLGLYGGAEWGALNLNVGAAYSRHDLTSQREVAFSGFAETLQADYGAWTAQVYGDVGYAFHVGGVHIEPFAGLAYAELHSDAYRESGGAATLAGDKQSLDILQGTLGVRGAATFRLWNMDVTARGTLAWRHAFEEVAPAATHAFDGSSAFTVYGAPVADAAFVEAGLETAVNERLMLGLSYSGLFGKDIETHGLQGRLSWSF